MLARMKGNYQLNEWVRAGTNGGQNASTSDAPSKPPGPSIPYTEIMKLLAEFTISTFLQVFLSPTSAQVLSVALLCLLSGQSNERPLILLHIRIHVAQML